MLFKKTAWVNLLVFFFFLSQSAVAQKIFIRVSEKDCINCYVGFFSELIDSPYKKDFKFLFPEKYEGKRFEQFNKLYFGNKVSADRVAFSDSLYTLTDEPLKGFSGITYIHDNQLISTLSIHELTNQKTNLNTYIKSLVTASPLVVFQEMGISDRLFLAASHNSNYFGISDFLFKNVYLWDKDKNLITIDFKDEVFQQVLKDNLSAEQYSSHLEHRGELIKYGKNYPEPYCISLSDTQLTIGYALSHVFLKRTSREELHIMPLLSIASLSLPSQKISVAKLVENSYIEDRTTSAYHLTMSLGTYEDRIYRINQLMYNSDDFAKNRTFPLLTKLEKNKNPNTRTLENKNISGLENFSFQQDTLLNKTFLMDILFSNIDQYILLQNYPYVIDIIQKKKHVLDWDSSVNHYYYPAKMTYEQLQFWQSEVGFTVLVRKNESYYLKMYTTDWVFATEKKLPFDSTTIKNLRFTNKNIYVFTENEILSFSNTFET